MKRITKSTSGRDTEDIAINYSEMYAEWMTVELLNCWFFGIIELKDITLLEGHA